jgi:hypothetical protein
MALGAGPVTAFAVGSGLASWVGYEIIFGAVVRFGVDLPYFAAKTVLFHYHILSTTAIP